MDKEKEFVPRKKTLTAQDMAELQKMFRETHVCRFENVSCDEMSFMKDLLQMYKETRSEIMRWVVKGILTALGTALFVGMYFKFGGKH